MKKIFIQSERGNRIYILSDEVAAIEVIPRKNGTVVLFRIDKKSIGKVRCYRWFNHNGYCCTIDEIGKQHPLPWVLFGKPKKGHVYHYLNGDIKDNRKRNLRLVSRSLSNSLKSGRTNRSTGVRGVSKYKDGSIVAVIGPSGKRKCFKTLDEAVKARKHYEKSRMKTISKPK